MKYYFLLVLAIYVGHAHSQSSCSSDKAVEVTTISERFTNADCEACWTKPLLATQAGITVDWLAPSPAGDDAPLSAAANRDATFRLEDLKVKLPKEQHIVKTDIRKSAYTIRVAHGLAVAGYIGSSIELTRFPKNLPIAKNLTAVLLLTETIPKGTADSPIERSLVRNMLIESWSISPISKMKTRKLAPDTAVTPVISRRPLSIPQGVNPDKLRVIGWVLDDQGRVLAAAQSLCIEPKE
jgi:hypothetical protein